VLELPSHENLAKNLCMAFGAVCAALAAVFNHEEA
jgi:hypothetical protein